MLIKCPECELQLSDKALTCPHCGYPMVKQEKSFTPSRSTRRRRLPNGFGQITEIKNKNLRNRFRAMITTSKTPEGRPVCKLLKPKAYFTTYNDAYAALMEYNRDPYDLDSVITMQELYDQWSKEYYKNLSVTGVRSYKAAWQYCSSIANMKVVDIRTRHLKECVENGSVIRKDKVISASSYSKCTMKTLLNMLFDYAVEYDIVEKNYARVFSLPKEISKDMEESRIDHIAFSDSELNIMWDHAEENDYIGFVLYQCYSGWRPTELCLLSVDDVHLDEGYVVGGIKTESGKNRIVPIHPKVREIVEREYNRAKVMKSPWLFNNLSAKPGENPQLSYYKYRLRFIGVMKRLKLDQSHKPHDPRKTFVTMAKKYNMDEYALKRIAGHDIDDITESIYTERSLDWYIEEMQKIK